jgi:methyltransferase
MVAHLAWIAAIFLLIPPGAEVIWPLIGLYAALQAPRYWVILTLGPYWTHRIITPRDGPVVTQGPFRIVRHPNYLVLMLETALLPLAFGAWAVSLVTTAVMGVVLYYKILLEDQALAARIEEKAASP